MFRELIYKMHRSISSCYSDISYLLSLFESISKNGHDSIVILDFGQTTFFAAELYLFFHNNLTTIKDICAEVRCINVRENIDYVMHLTNINSNILPEYFSSIKHKSFIDDLNKNDLNCFDKYISSEFDKKSGLTASANIYLRNYLSEIFVNSRTHGNTNNIFFSGQIYNQLGLLRIVMFDTGITIPYNVENFEINGKNNYYHNNDGAAIRWANEKGNSTKKTLGGLGLSSVRDFINETNGSIQIFSRYGYYCNKGNDVTIKNLSYRVNGTLTIIEINTNNLNVFKISRSTNSLDF